MRRLMAIGVAVCVLAVMVGAAAALGSRGRTTNASIPFPPDTQQTTTATCPTGTHATGGGFQVSPGATPGSFPNTFTTNSNFKDRRSWTVVSGATSASASGTLTASVRCERKRDGRIGILLPGSHTVTPDTTAPYAATGQGLNFICPPGTHPIGGGYSVDRPYDPNAASNRWFATQNRRTGGTWTISGYLMGGPAASTPPAEFTGKVPCERNGVRPLVERKVVVPYLENQRTTASAKCRRGTHVVSGGFAFSPIGEGSVPVPFVDQDVPTTNRTWAVSAYDSGTFATPAGSTMTVSAYCRKNRPRWQGARRGAAASVAPLVPGRVEATPPTHVSVLGG